MLHKQRGASYVVILLVLIIVITTTKALVAIVPAYWNDHVLNNEIQSTLSASDYSVTADFQERLKARLSLQGLNHLNADEMLSVADKGNTLEKKYQTNAHFVANIDFLMRFEKSFSISAANK